MAASRSDRVYHQDYIARIRYSNTLPPPPNPPKLLDIPDASLASGQYTSTSFAARLSREQPLNIEADAELGMPLNLIGLPGVFDGDESIIYGLDHPPPPHPHDRALLRPLSMLGKGTAVGGVSFLRRTEYIASEATTRIEGSKSRLKQDNRKRKRPELDKEDPRRMIDDIVKGFNIAYPQDKSGKLGTQISIEEQRAWDKPRHPTNPSLQLLDAYPLLPDLEALGDTGAYLLTKFVTNPTTATDVYDSRLDLGLLRPLEQDPDDVEKHAVHDAARAADPTLEPLPVHYDFEYFLPAIDEEITVQHLKSRFDVNSTDREDEQFQYKRIRAYETYKGTQADDPFNDTIALALHDAEESGNKRARLQKGAYYYPIAQRNLIRPKKPLANQEDETHQSRVDVLNVLVRDQDEAEEQQRLGHGRMMLEGEMGEEEQGEENGAVNGGEAARAMPVAEEAVEGAV